MAGPASAPGAAFRPPHVPQRFRAAAYMAPIWFFVMYRFYKDGPHHFLGHHTWTEPKYLAYLEEVDKKYGTKLATDNMHH